MKSLWDAIQFYKKFYNVVFSNAIFLSLWQGEVAFQEYDAKNAPECEGCLFWEEKRNREGGNNFEWKNQKNDKDL